MEFAKRLLPRWEIIGLLCAAALLTLPMLAFAQTKGATVAAAGPVPAEIATAKKAFISNSPGFNLSASLGGPNRAYNEFYAAMKSWGRYELVSSPVDADLIFEISYNSNNLGLGARGLFLSESGEFMPCDPRCENSGAAVVAKRAGGAEDVFWTPSGNLG